MSPVARRGAARTVGTVDGAILSTDGDTPYAAARAAIIAALPGCAS